ncbi:MAG: class I SAM-dependent methyltransferase [Verrucomicrobia bacterium]|nr:class I SAM-dependent methyltransferase [Verrucomicrobiota bacterium]
MKRITLSRLAKPLIQPLKRFQKKRKIKKVLDSGDLTDKFTTIYRHRLWSSKESISGTGSTIDVTTHLRTQLPLLLKKYAIGKLVDAPCGDFNWMKLVVEQIDIEYVGVDIVEDLISDNNKVYSSSKCSFEVGNICKDNLPSCDLLLVRDCLFHLSFSDIDNFLKNIAQLDYKYLLTTSFETSGEFLNKDIQSGGFRDIDILKSPFLFPQEMIKEAIVDEGNKNKHLYLFDKASVPTQLNSQ